MPRNLSFAVVLLCFFLSGCAGLLYQTAWTREFEFIFGTSGLAVSAVLAAYMAGLAAGAGLAARYALRVTRPVLAYGVLELGIGLAALGLPWAVHGSLAVYVALFGEQPGLPVSGTLVPTLFQLGSAFVILMIPTAMMGATLPLLVRHAVRHRDEIGSRTGLLYGVNTAGAVVGTLVAAYLLLPAVGLRPTVWVGVGLNGVVFLGAWWLARSQPLLPVESPEALRATEIGHRWILPLIGVSGAASFAYEVIWVRLLAHVLGSSIYAFATMLASFLTGIALGSALAARFATTRTRAAAGFALAQVGTATLSSAAFVAVDEVPRWVAGIAASGVDRALAQATVSVGLLLPATLCIGATFPFAVRLLAANEHDAGPASARVFSANTLGSIVGALATGFLVLPALGFVGAVSACIAVNLGLAVVTLLLGEPRRRLLAGACAIGMVGLSFVQLPQPWNLLRNTPRSAGPGGGDIVYFGVGRATTVLLSKARGRWFLRTGGLPEASIEPPYFLSLEKVAPWLGALPSMLRADLRSMLVVGLGGGVALERIPDSVERIDVVELEGEVVAANRFIGDARARDPLSDSRVEVHVNDARNALLLTGRRFDAIVSQPSHPWAGGAAHLYTREFFDLANARLSDRGVFVQWIGLAFVDEELLASLLASLVDVFEHVRVYHPPGALLFAASQAPFDDAVPAEVLARSPEALAAIGLRVPEDLVAGLLLDEDGARALAEGAPLNVDGNNLLQTRSPGVRGRSLIGRVSGLAPDLDPLRRLPAGLDRMYLLRQLPAWRSRRAADSLEDPIERRVAAAWADLQSGKRQGPRNAIVEVLGERPFDAAARAALLLIDELSIVGGDQLDPLLARPLLDSEKVIVGGWRRVHDVAALESLEAMLAGIPPRDALAPAAYRLRAQWRIQSGREPEALEAITLADLAFQASNGDPRDLLLRAEACSRAGRDAAALHTLLLLQRRLDDRTPRSRSLARLGLGVLRSLQPPEERNAFYAEVERALRLRAAGRRR